MLSRFKIAATAIAGCAVLLSAAPSHAIYGPSIAPFLEQANGSTAAGACSYLFNGPSLNPNSTPFHVVGSGTIESTRVVVSTSIRCKIRFHNGADLNPVLAQALPFNSSAVEGDIPVSNLSASYDICTMIDAVFSDTTHFNPNETYQCRPLTSIL